MIVTPWADDELWEWYESDSKARSLVRLALDAHEPALPFPRLVPTGEPVTFALAGPPVPKARPRFTCARGKPRTYAAEGQEAAEGRVVKAFMDVSRFRRLDPGKLWAVDLAFRVERSRQRKDIDNLAKLVLDALNGWAWKDDRQVARLTVNLWRDSEDPVTVCTIQELTRQAG